MYIKNLVLLFARLDRKDKELIDQLIKAMVQVEMYQRDLEIKALKQENMRLKKKLYWEAKYGSIHSN